MLRNGNGTRRNPVARGVRRAILAMGLVVVSALATASAANAGRLHEQTCVGERGRYTICLYITDDPQSPYTHHYKVHVGIDVNMSRSDALNIIAGGGTMTARMWGADVFHEDNLIGVTRSWMEAGDEENGGLGAEFDRSVSGSVLNEDWEGGDEVYATVSLYVPVSGTTRNFRSDTVVAHFNGGPLD